MLFDHKPSQNNEISIQYIIVYSTMYIVENSFSSRLLARNVDFKQIASKEQIYKLRIYAWKNQFCVL